MRSAHNTLVALAAAACGILVGPAGFASAAPDSAVGTIGRLQADGYTVTIDRVGSAQLSDCQVISVRNPQEQTRLIRVESRDGHDRFIPIVVNRTITVSLDCSSR
jgi:hypothetical protein